MAVDLNEKQEQIRSLLLNELLQDERMFPENVLEGLESASVTDLCQDDDISLLSIDNFDNIANGLSGRRTTTMAPYHKVIWARVCEMSSTEAIEYVSVIAAGMSQLGLKEREKGIDSYDTKQKTLLLCWMSERVSAASCNNMDVDDKFRRNVIVRLLNKKGKSNKNKTSDELELQDRTSTVSADQSMLQPGHYQVLCAFDKYYNKFCPRSKTENGRQQTEKKSRRSILRVLLELVEYIDDPENKYTIVGNINPFGQHENGSTKYVLVPVSEVGVICATPSKFVDLV